MPKRLVVIGGTYCLLGCLSVVDMLIGALRGAGLDLQLSLFLLPVGLGLLKARPSSRRWATFWAGFSGAVTLAVLVAAIGWDGSIELGVNGVALSPGVEQVLGWGSAVATLALSVGVIWMLYTPPVSLAFSDARRSPDSPV